VSVWSRWRHNARVSAGPVIALIDGEHHPSAVRDALDRLERERGLAAVLFCGGEEKVGPGVLEAPEAHYGRAVETGDPEGELHRLRGGPARAVVDLADEPVLTPERRLHLAAVALGLGLTYEAPGTLLTPPPRERLDFAGPKLAVIATAKRTGKTAVAGHWAGLLRDRGLRPVVVCMGRGGPPGPQVAEPGTSLDELVALADSGAHAASDYLEDAALAGVTTVGCRRVGGGLAGEPYDSNMAAGATLAASLAPDALILEGSGACIPPLEADRTVCLVGDPSGATGALGPYRLGVADLVLVMGGGDDVAAAAAGETSAPVLRCRLLPEPVEPVPTDARVALFSTSEAAPDGVTPIVRSANLARRTALERDLDRAAAERCDVYLTELKAAAIDTVARRARTQGARVTFVRNRPVSIDGDLDAALMGLYDDV
jgi:cyclic 2,3-diphosphoglycerate synthase